MTRILKSFLFLFCLSFSGFTTKKGEVFEWTGFRGSHGTGMDTTMAAPTVWDSADYLWEIELEGEGSSSPVVWGDKVFVTSSDDQTISGNLFAIDAGSGRTLWQKRFELGDLAMHPDNAFASASPAVDGSHIYVIWYTKERTTLIALDHEGSLQWESAFDGIEARHGGGSSLVLSAENVIFTREQEDGSSVKSSWVAINKKTGKISWELQRETSPSNSFSTPIIVDISNERQQLIFSSFAHGFTGVDATTGHILWEIPGVLKHRVVGSPSYANGFLVGFYKGGGVILEVDLASNQVADSILYAVPRSVAPYVPSPIIVGDLLFLFMDSGVVSCLNLLDGKILWKERPAGPIYGSPICVAGNLYCITKAGRVIVIPASSSYKLEGVYELGEGSFSTPAMCNEGMLFRTFTKLILLSNSKD